MKMLVLMILGMMVVGRASAQDSLRAKPSNFIGNPFSFTRSSLSLPDSLGGDRIKVSLVISLKIDTSGTILSYHVVRFKASDERGVNIIDYREGTNKDVGKLWRYTRWLNHYVKGIVVTKNPKFPADYMQEFGRRGYTLLLPVQINE